MQQRLGGILFKRVIGINHMPVRFEFVTFCPG